MTLIEIAKASAVFAVSIAAALVGIAIFSFWVCAPLIALCEQSVAWCGAFLALSFVAPLYYQTVLRPLWPVGVKTFGVLFD